jgi:hypothetical protein
MTDLLNLYGRDQSCSIYPVIHPIFAMYVFWMNQDKWGVINHARTILFRLFI